MIIKFNGKEILNTFVKSNSWLDYPGILIVDYPVNRIEILYDNDHWDKESRTDRNLYIKNIRLRTL